jgi:hypothetical protein
MPKFDIKFDDVKSEAQRGLHAGVGAADLAIEAVMEYVVEAQKKAQELFEAYQMAVEARDALRGRQFNANLVREYDETCFEIERHVIRAMQETSYAQRTS